MNIEKNYDLSFPLEKVYATWISSDTVIAPATSMDILPKLGGHYRLVVDTPEFKGKNEGVFLLVDPNCHLCYTWEWNNDGEVSEIDVNFSATGKGTAIRILHSGFVNQASADRHDQGWDSYIEGFKLFLSKAV
ncbi:SRPBCC domain-containing protein [uncultured Paraglaciecola sp.]|uniref:SRPBCC family protein n=1 Tax=uncultured Paraglaciecola sp. TaxID=1765024 RepID=UPI0030D7B1BB|tara:strand:- start:301760 stop:302158 length:399 start_codon:yes stop_codon:yes gene_type:complete